MDWKVGNALSRDVERQHLNKILADIRTTITNLPKTSTSGGGQSIVNTVTRYAVARFTLNLIGDVTGSALIDGTGNVDLTTTLSDIEGFVEEAPIDNQYYWRWNGEWKPAPNPDPADGVGILVQVENAEYEKETIVREIEEVVGETVVTDGDGVAGNPTIGLADTGVTADTYGDATHTLELEIDAKGRILNVTEHEISSSGGILPMVTGDVPPVLVYTEDGSLVYVEVV